MQRRGQGRGECRCLRPWMYVIVTSPGLEQSQFCMPYITLDPQTKLTHTHTYTHTYTHKHIDFTGNRKTLVGFKTVLDIKKLTTKTILTIQVKHFLLLLHRLIYLYVCFRRLFCSLRSKVSANSKFFKEKLFYILFWSVFP